MNKSELISSVSERTELTNAQAERALNAVLEAMTDSLSRGDQVQIPGFGSFVVRERAARTGRNPRTGETIQVAASKSVGFKAGKKLKDAL